VILGSASSESLSPSEFVYVQNSGSTLKTSVRLRIRLEEIPAYIAVDCATLIHATDRVVKHLTTVLSKNMSDFFKLEKGEEKEEEERRGEERRGEDKEREFGGDELIVAQRSPLGSYVIENSTPKCKFVLFLLL